MSKIKTYFQCQACGYGSPKWLGKCPDCSAWNSFTEERELPKSLKSPAIAGSASSPQPLNTVTSIQAQRITTDIAEFDRVLGGGLISGAMILIGGDPGIGKSTLVLQAASRIADKMGSVLYVSGEESAEQILKNKGPEITDMRVVVDRRPAGVERNLSRLKRREFLEFSSEGVMEFYHLTLSSSRRSCGRSRQGLRLRARALRASGP